MFTPKQKSQLTDAITQLGMDRSYFEFVENDTELRLTYSPTGFYFRVTTLHLNSFAHKPVIALMTYHIPSFGGLTPSSYQEVDQRFPDWQGVFANEKDWLAWIKREYYEQTPHGQTELEEYREIAETVATTSTTPLFLASKPKLTHLHPTVQGVAAKLFAGTHYPQAILAACTALDKAVQAKAQLPASTVGTALMTTAFSVKAPLVQLSQDTNEQLGFMNLYQGSVQAIRNHYAHNLTEIPAPRALEWLGFISALFYKLDEVQTPIASPIS